MTTTETEILYRKVGRRYVPAYSMSEWSYDKDMMPVGSFRLTHACSDGGRRYEYDVEPDTAAWVAAATLAIGAMELAIHKANKMTVSSSTPFTKRQQDAVKEATSILEAANVFGRTWVSSSAREVAQAGIDAVRNWAMEPTAKEQK